MCRVSGRSLGEASHNTLTYGAVPSISSLDCCHESNQRRLSETAILDGKTVIPGGQSVIPGGTNRDRGRKICRFTAIPGGTNRDPRRKMVLLNPCKSGIFRAQISRSLLVVLLFIVMFTNKGTLSQNKVCVHRTLGERAADGEKRD